jgi:UTP--glucose-1-phosphate uridylyltransferase
VLKLSSGLGNHDGMRGPEEWIPVRNWMYFIDVKVKQLRHLNKSYGSDVPLILMNSFNTDKKTEKLIRTFSQFAFPRISTNDLMPIDENVCYPHGDFFFSPQLSGLLEELKGEGREYPFVSNVDNLTATVDLRILQYCVAEGVDFCMEVTSKTSSDAKSGTLVKVNGNITLLEIAHVRSAKKNEFTNIRKFKLFDTKST